MDSDKFFWEFVMAGHSRPKDGVASLAYVPPAGQKPLRRGEGPAIHVLRRGETLVGRNKRKAH